MSEPTPFSVDFVAGGNPQEVMVDLVRLAAEDVDADRCTLTSIDQSVMRVEASWEAGRPSLALVGREYPLDYVDEQPLLRQAVETRSVVTGGSLSDEGRVDPTIAPALEAMQRTAIVPLVVGNSVGAVLILSRKHDRPFAAAELQRLQPLGVIAGMAMSNARLIEEIKRAQVRGLDTLRQMSEYVATSDAPATFFGKMSERVARLVGADRAAFWRIEEDELVAQREAHGFRSAEMERLRMPLPTTVDGSPVARLLFGDEARNYRAGDDVTWSEDAGMLRALGARDMLAVPWRTVRGPIGMLAALDSERGFSAQDEWIMRLAARASALVWLGYEAERRAEQLQEEERQRLQAHALRMADLDHQKTEFLQLASHELRTPLTLVVGYLSMLEEGALGDLPPAAANVIPLMTTRTAQMNNLVDRMLVASRLEDTSRAASVRDVDVVGLVRDVVASMEVNKESNRHRIRVEAAQVPPVRGDPEELETIVGNLLSNAVKYSPDGGDVTVSVACDGEDVRVDVRDQGIGIAEADRAKLFRPFTRLESAQNAGIPGTGLGLYLSRSLAKSQGGDIEVESEPGNGTTFTLRLAVRGFA